MSLFDKKLRAHKLRREGKSIKDIATALSISRSTASVWCQEIVLTKTQQEKLFKKQVEAGHLGRMRGAEVNRNRKLENIATQEYIAREMVGKISERDRLMLGIGLYWGEGVKASGSGGASLVNSDPAIVLCARDWFERLGVKREDFSPYIFISDTHKSREEELYTFWSKYLSIPRSQFHKVVFLKGRRKKVYENHNSYYGILTLRVRKSMSLKYMILGLIKETKCRCSSVG